MHFQFPFTALSVLWTLTFAAHLVLLVVLMGRDRVRQFPWFTVNITLVALRLLTSRLLFGRLPQVTMAEVFIIMAAAGAFVSLMVVVEVARRAFRGARRVSWLIGALVLMAAGAAVLRFWGQWPAWATFKSAPPLNVAQLLAQKAMLLADVENIGLGLLVILFGRRSGAGFKSKAQQVAIGLMTASLSQLGIQAIWERIAATAQPHSQQEYEHVIGLRDKLFNTNNAVYIAVLIWWIVCLWIDPPKEVTEEEPVPEAVSGSVLRIPMPVERPAPVEDVVAEDGSVHGRELPRGPE
ncbi:hypothetical protein DYQ86_26425 [Acidobacteria bacterium AB60]|nr:hypothetical protein DYQ86_26425 [Acidobacteria bacterium AB60]